MKISCLSETITVIELTAQEMTDYDFSFEHSDYSSAHTRRVLWSIIDEASKIIGREVEVTEGLEIDFLPDKSGGCMMIISQGSGQDDSLLYQNEETVLEGDSADDFLDFAKAALSSAEKKDSSFYSLPRRWRMILSPGGESIVRLAGEYGLRLLSEPLSAESTREGYCCVIPSDALEILGGFAAK